MERSAATFSAVSPMDSSGKRSAIFGLVKRQPSEVSNIAGTVRVEGLGGLGHDEGRAGHALDAARDHHVALARGDGAVRVLDRLEPGAAEAVDRDSGDLVGQPREQQRHASDVAVVLAGLVGGAEDHLVDGLARCRGAVEQGA
jgi:hypothetical protein